MYIFLVDYFMPFPISEYGGLQCVVAQNEDAVIKILAESVDDFYKKEYDDIEQCIKDWVNRSVRLKLDDSIRLEPGIVTQFLT
jgi:hypothetical protein